MRGDRPPRDHRTKGGELMRGQLPKAYLRVDPNLDAHPDPGAIVMLMLWANRQPRRGRFKSLAVVEKLIGKKRVRAAIDRGDLIEEAVGVLYLQGWDEWQEKDLDVASRMRILREKRRNNVTPPSVTNPSPPSEASRRQGVKASEQRTDPPAVAVAAIPKPTVPEWNSEFADDFIAAYGGPPPKQLFPQVRDIARRYGWARTRPALREYMAETQLDYLAIPKVLAVRIESAEAGRPKARASPGKPTVGDRAMAAASEFLKQGEG